MNVNVNLMAGNVIQIKSGVAINADVSTKIQENIISEKKIIFGILTHVLARLLNI